MEELKVVQGEEAEKKEETALEEKNLEEVAGGSGISTYCPLCHAHHAPGQHIVPLKE